MAQRRVRPSLPDAPAAAGTSSAIQPVQQDDFLLAPLPADRKSKLPWVSTLSGTVRMAFIADCGTEEMRVLLFSSELGHAGMSELFHIRWEDCGRGLVQMWASAVHGGDREAFDWAADRITDGVNRLAVDMAAWHCSAVECNYVPVLATPRLCYFQADDAGCSIDAAQHVFTELAGAVDAAVARAPWPSKYAPALSRIKPMRLAVFSVEDETRWEVDAAVYGCEGTGLPPCDITFTGGRGSMVVNGLGMCVTLPASLRLGVRILESAEDYATAMLHYMHIRTYQDALLGRWHTTLSHHDPRLSGRARGAQDSRQTLHIPV